MSEPSATTSANPPLHRIRIVLVGTQHPGNIGSAARALKTMGLSRLVLVAPSRFPHGEADALAAGADDILAAAEIHESLGDAVAGNAQVQATSPSRHANRTPRISRKFSVPLRARQRRA